MKHFCFIAFLILLFQFSCKRSSGPYPPVSIDMYFKNVIKKTDVDTSLTFIVIGDWGKQGEAIISVSEQMADVADYLDIKFVITTGDNFYSDGVDSITDPVWNVYTDNFNQESLDVPWYISLGNHDHYGNVQVQVDYSEIDDRWNLPSFFYTLNKAINNQEDSLGLIVIDSYRLRADPSDLNQISWIDSVSQNMSTPWKIMIGHHPLFSYGYHGDDATMQNLLNGTLLNNKVDLYICGHDHDLQHINIGTYTDFFISGSAAKLRDTGSGPNSLFSISEHGFLLIQLSRHVLQSYFIDENGEVLYRHKRLKI